MTNGSHSANDGGGPPARHKVTRRVIAFVIGLVLAGSALVALVAMRVAIVEAVLANRLGALGLADVELAVEAVGLRQTRIGAVRIGRAGELRVARVTATYDLRELLRGALPRIEIDGLRLDAAVGAEGLSLGSLDALLTPGDGETQAVRLPSIRLRDGRVEMATPAGPLTIAIDGVVEGSDGGAIVADLAIALESEYGSLTGTLATTLDDRGAVSGAFVVTRGHLRPPGGRIDGLTGRVAFAVGSGGRFESATARFAVPRTAFGQVSLGAAELVVDYDRGRVAFDAAVKDEGGGLAATVRAEIEDVHATSPATLAVEAGATAGSVLWRLIDLPAPDSGRGRLNLTAAGPIPPLAALASDPAAGLDRLVEGGLAGTLALRIEDVGYADFVAGLGVALDMDVAIDASGVAVSLPGEGRVAAERLTPRLLRLAGLSGGDVEGLEGPLSLTLEGIADAPFRLVLRPGDDASAIDVAGAAALRLADGAAIEIEASGVVNLGARGDLPLFELPGFALRLSDLSVAGHRLAEARASGRLGGTALDELEGAVDLSLALPQFAADDVSLADISVAAPIRFRLAGNRIGLWSGGSGVVEAGHLTVEGRLRLDAPLRLTFEGQERPVLELEFDSSGGVSFSHYAKVRTGAIAGQVLGDGGEPVSFAVDPVTIRLNGSRPRRAPYRTSIELSGAGFSLPGHDVAAGEFGASTILDLSVDGLIGDGPVGRFGIKDVRHLGEPALLVPLQITGTIDRHDGALVFAVNGADPAGVRRIVVTGRHRPATGVGEARVEIAPVTFAPGGLQPQALLPALADLGSVSGGVAALARLRWDADGFGGEAELRLDDLSFKQSEVSVEGLTATIRLDSLTPPSTPPGQVISVRRIDPALPLTDVTLRFQLDAGGDAALGRLRVEHAEAGIAGGRIMLDDAVIEPGAARHDATLVMSGLDLEQMFRIIDVDGLSGSGTLSGSIPLAVTDETVIVAGGLLTADGAGVIRYRSEQAAQALSGGGEQVDLMLRALQDFRYDNLSISLDKGAIGDTRIGLRMLGHNPEVLDGHPFQFNINLSGNLDKVLAAVLEGYRASNNLLDRAFAIQ